MQVSTINFPGFSASFIANNVFEPLILIPLPLEPLRQVHHFLPQRLQFCRQSRNLGVLLAYFALKLELLGVELSGELVDVRQVLVDPSLLRTRFLGEKVRNILNGNHATFVV